MKGRGLPEHVRKRFYEAGREAFRRGEGLSGDDSPEWQAWRAGWSREYCEARNAQQMADDAQRSLMADAAWRARMEA